MKCLDEDEGLTRERSEFTGLDIPLRKWVLKMDLKASEVDKEVKKKKVWSFQPISQLINSAFQVFWTLQDGMWDSLSPADGILMSRVCVWYIKSGIDRRQRSTERQLVRPSLVAKSRGRWLIPGGRQGGLLYGVTRNACCRLSSRVELNANRFNFQVQRGCTFSSRRVSPLFSSPPSRLWVLSRQQARDDPRGSTDSWCQLNPTPFFQTAVRFLLKLVRLGLEGGLGTTVADVFLSQKFYWKWREEARTSGAREKDTGWRHVCR